MNKIEKHIKEKYYDNDFERYLYLISRYHKIISFVKKPYYYVVSTYFCYRYPFLKFDIKSGFIQRYCYWWSIPDGWRKAFGKTMCEEIRKELKHSGFLHKYQITDVKEKYGKLTIYDDGAPEEIHDILLKYEYISARTCIVCGRLAKYRTDGWVEPYCEECIKNVNTRNKPYEFYKDIDWYGWRKS